ncbi:MBL fold metallo-hydrolase [Candidatus Parcubacteria bacterium]|nr:MBL fold metallo-hydrolase [Candidatus Parcubacteria bacterium]
MKIGYKKILSIATLIFVAIFIISFEKGLLNKVEYLQVSFLDVGQGDSVFIEAPNGVQMIVDGGPDDSVLRELSKVMPFWDRSIDIVVATHPDKDHIGGLPEIFQRFKVGTSLDTGVTSDTGIYNEYKKRRASSSANLVQAHSGQVISLDEKSGVYVEVLFPGESLNEIKDKNDTSIILRVVYGESEVLLTGDASVKIERFLLSKYGKNLESDILKLGHHGSKTSTSKEFLEKVNPESVVISAGVDNSYGHPSKETLYIVNNFGSKIYSTIDSGIVSFYLYPDIIEGIKPYITTSLEYHENWLP